MGHSDVGVTLNVYTHVSYDRVAEQIAKILDFKEADMQGKKKIRLRNEPIYYTICP